MKTKFNLRNWVTSVVFIMLLSSGAHLALAQADYIICSFDTDYCQINTDNSPPPSGFHWTNDIGNPPGSVYVVIDWQNNPSGWQDTKISWDVPYPGVDCPNYANVEFDVKIDRANSYPATDGNYGGVQVVCQGWPGWGLNTEGHWWSAIGSVTLIATDGWQHVSVPLTAYPYTLSRLCLNFYGNPPSATTNRICYFIDNIKLTAPPAPPPTLALQMRPKPKPGLHLFTPVDGNQWQRQSIRTVGTGYGWYNTGAPTTYALTIADFPFLGEVTTNYSWYFDSDAEVASWWKWWGVDVSFSWDGTEPDAGGRCTNGSMYVVANFTEAGGEQFSIAGSFATPLDGTKYDTLMFDIKVDPTSGPIQSGTDYGTIDSIGFIASDWSQINLGSYTIPLAATNWTRVALPINRSNPNLKGIQGVWLKMWSGDAHTNALKFWIDNLVVRATPSTYQVHMFIAPGPNTGLPIAPDWNETNCLFVQIQMGQNGQAMAAVRYKTNYPNSNGGTNIVAYQTNADCTVTALQDNYFGACVLATISNGPVLGTWSLTFHDNANATFSGPGGSTNFTIPSAVLDAMFANYDGNTLVYFGADPNGTNGIGHEAVLSRVIVSNQMFYPIIDDDFSAPALNTELWAVSADAVDGVFVVPAGAKGWLTWSLPDTGFRLQSSPSLANPNTWTEPTLRTFVNKDHRQALLGPSYDFEVTDLAISYTTLPTDVVVRESPTVASVGDISLRPISTSSSATNYYFKSSLSLWLDVSIDNGTNWVSATNGPAVLTLSGTFESPLFPPIPYAQYVSVPGWQGLYPNGVVISNLIIQNFSQSFELPNDPADPITDAEIIGLISLDGGQNFTDFYISGQLTLTTTAAGQRFFRLVKPGS